MSKTSRRRGRGRRARKTASRPYLAAFRRGLRRRRALVALLAVAISAAVVSLFLLGTRSSEPPGPPRAVIVDQLSLTFPNQNFIDAATDTLQRAGYEVDYYPGEEVTIDFYEDLPTHDYEVVILRVHSARHRGPDRELTDNVVLFTGEPYSREIHVQQRKAGLLTRARYFRTDPPSYFFGIPAKFVELKMRGNFEGATVILMGCDGLRSNTMAEAFIKKGAEAFISWDVKVSASHTDAATERLIHHLLIDERPLSGAVTLVMDEIGPDPAYGARLLIYPAEASGSALP